MSFFCWDNGPGFDCSCRQSRARTVPVDASCYVDGRCILFSVAQQQDRGLIARHSSAFVPMPQHVALTIKEIWLSLEGCGTARQVE